MKVNIRAAITAAASIVLMIVLTACGAQAANPGDALATGDFIIDFTTDPTPVTQGPVQLIVTLKDKSGALVEGATVHLSLTMTTMNMGASTGKATDEGKGKYTIKTSLDHSGTAKVTIEAEKDKLKGVKETTFDVK